MTEKFEKPETEKDLGTQIIENAFGASRPDILKNLFCAQGTDVQRKNLAELLRGRLPVDKEK